MTNGWMKAVRRGVAGLMAIGLLWLGAPHAAGETGAAQAPRAQDSAYEPQEGQEGKDVVWVPTHEAVVEAMLDLGRVTAADRLIDLGAGDGRTVIAAARRGATAHGIEYNAQMVELARRNAAAAGLAERTTVEEADLFEADLSSATVITMFLLPSINLEVRPKLLALQPGTRIVSNSFNMGEWESDNHRTVEDGCTRWCTALLWVVPAKVAGTWQIADDTLELAQEFQMVSGTLGGAALTGGRLYGNQITFTVGATTYIARVSGATMEGIAGGRPWRASRVEP